MEYFRVTLREELVKNVIVYAEDDFDAEHLVAELYRDGEITLDSEDFSEMEISEVESISANEIDWYKNKDLIYYCEIKNDGETCSGCKHELNYGEAESCIDCSRYVNQADNWEPIK